MIKVVHVISDVGIGGAGKWLLNLLGDIDKNEFVTKVILPRNSLLVKLFNEIDIQTIEVNGIADKSFDMTTVHKLYNIFKDEKIDILHTHAVLSARLAGKLAGIKAIVHTKHCIDAVRTGWKKTAGVILNKYLSNKVIAVSHAVCKNLIDSGLPANMIETIYGAVPETVKLNQMQIQQIKQKWGIRPDDIVIGIVARFAEVKGQKYFVEAAGLLADFKNIKFIMVGIGPTEKQLRELVNNLNLEKSVIFAGYVEKVYEIYNILDINVISSISEALCLSLIEGMYIEKPCVGSDTGGIPEVIQDGVNGFLVPKADSKALADKMRILVENPELRNEMGKRGKQIAESKFDIKTMTRKIENLYRDLI